MNEEIIKLYQNGESMREIAKLTHHSRNTISKILKENNIHVRYQNETSKIYTCNESYFKEINSPDKAYWLGFLMADGFIESKRKNGNQKFGVTLQIKDEKHLYKFKEALTEGWPVSAIKLLCTAGSLSSMGRSMIPEGSSSAPSTIAIYSFSPPFLVSTAAEWECFPITIIPEVSISRRPTTWNFAFP